MVNRPSLSVRAVLLTPLAIAVTEMLAPSIGNESGPVTRPRMMSGSCALSVAGVTTASVKSAANAARIRTEDKMRVST